MGLKKVISGGQTGADQGGLAAAKLVGLETGGTAPAGYRTEVGPAVELLRDTFGLVESESADYAVRTAANVRDADGTVVFGDITSPGSKRTVAECRTANRPVCINPSPAELAEWIATHHIRVLNVAGNRERTTPGIGLRVLDIMVSALEDPEEPGATVVRMAIAEALANAIGHLAEQFDFNQVAADKAEAAQRRRDGGADDQRGAGVDDDAEGAPRGAGAAARPKRA